MVTRHVIAECELTDLESCTCDRTALTRVNTCERAACVICRFDWVVIDWETQIGLLSTLLFLSRDQIPDKCMIIKQRSFLMFAFLWFLLLSVRREIESEVFVGIVLSHGALGCL